MHGRASGASRRLGESDIDIDIDLDIDLVVVGGPTHAFSISRPQTRADAVEKGAQKGAAETGIRKWLAALPAGQP